MIKDGNLEATFSRVTISAFVFLCFYGMESIFIGLTGVLDVLAFVSSKSQKLGVDISMENFEL